MGNSKGILQETSHTVGNNWDGSEDGGWSKPLN